MKQMQKIGPLKNIMKMMPGMAGQLDAMEMQGDEMAKMEAIILSMTNQERQDPSVVEASRRRRIARGSGTDVQDVSGMIKSFNMASGMMQQMAGMGTRDRMKFAQQMGQMGLMGATPRFKIKQRSRRLTKKDRAKRKKRGKR